MKLIARYGYKGWRLVSVCPICMRPLLTPKECISILKSLGKSDLNSIINNFKLGRKIHCFAVWVAGSEETAKNLDFRKVIYPICRNCGRKFGDKPPQEILSKIKETLKGVFKHAGAINVTRLLEEEDEAAEKYISRLALPDERSSSSLKNYKRMYRLLTEGRFEEEAPPTAAILDLLRMAKIFEISDEVSLMLSLTKNKVRPVKMPFPVIFLETEFETDLQEKVHGILAVELEHGDVGLISQLGNGEEVYLVVGSLLLSRGDKWGIKRFFVNFIDFLENREVEFVYVKRTEKSRKKRMMKGKIPLPSSRIIKITGVLKKYVRELKTGKHFTYSHRFWVRGHWRHFKHPRFTKMRGKKRWIPPYIKGSGILIDKRYRLVKE